MSKYFIYSLILITFFIPLNTVMGSNPDVFYGHNSLTPSVNKETVIMPLPGGSKSIIDGNGIIYSINDHLGSTRLALNTNNTVQKTADYTPFGDSKIKNSDLTGNYTGMTFEPETNTHDYHARRYDPGVGRFLSLDLQREDASPYIYVGNNPIVFTDPNGQGKRKKVSAPMFFEEDNIKLSDRRLTSMIKTELEGYRNQRPTLLSAFEKTVIKKGERVGTEIDSLVSRNTPTILRGKSTTIERIPNNRAYFFIGKGDYDVEPSDNFIEDMRKLSVVNTQTVKSPDNFAEEIVILDFSEQGRSAKLLSALKQVTDGQLVSLIRLEATSGMKEGKERIINKIGFDGNDLFKYEEGMLSKHIDTMVAKEKRVAKVVQGADRVLGRIQSGVLPTGSLATHPVQLHPTGAGLTGGYVYIHPTGAGLTGGYITPSEHLLYPTHFTTMPSMAGQGSSRGGSHVFSVL